MENSSQAFRKLILLSSLIFLGASLQACSPTIAKLKAGEIPNSSSGESTAQLSRIQLLTTPELKAQPGQSLTLQANFHAVPMDKNYHVFLQLVDDQGRVGFVTSFEPLVPTSQWKGLVIDSRKIILPAQIAGGTYAIRMGLHENIPPYTSRVKLEAGPGVTADSELRYQVGTLAVEPLASAPTACPSPKGQDAKGYHLVFQDEFENSILNSETWNETLWYEASNPTKNFAVENGSLKIWPQKDESGNFFNRTLDTDGKYQQTYGFFEVQAKLPVGKGAWPAFWLFNHIDDRRPQIAVMEAFASGGVEAGWSDATFHPTAFAVSLWTTTDQLQNRKVLQTSDLSLAFHAYGLKWEADRLTFYFDGKEFWSTAGTFSDPMYLMLNLWFGDLSGDPDDSTPQSQMNSLEVQYIRAWQFGPGPGISCP